MIQSFLYFALGALGAGLLALLLTPAFVRRAERLTRRRIEASMPLTLNEIQAGRDHVRAQAAMAIRRAEIDAKSSRDKANAEIIEAGRQAAGANKLREVVAARESSLAVLGTERDDLAKRLAEREKELASANERVAELTQSGEEKGREIERLGRLYEESSFLSSDRQIQLVARDSQIEQQDQDMAGLKAELDALKAEMERPSPQAVAADGSLEPEKIQSDEDLEAKLQQTLSSLTEREAQVDARERELSEAPEPKTSELVKDVGVEERASEAELERRRLEDEIAALRAELEARSAAPASQTDHEDAALREQMSRLAAEVIAMTAALDGPDSPIRKALTVRNEANGSGRPLSLADRVRALQQAASEANPADP